jgi:hypothetical protein
MVKGSIILDDEFALRDTVTLRLQGSLATSLVALFPNFSHGFKRPWRLTGLVSPSILTLCYEAYGSKLGKLVWNRFYYLAITMKNNQNKFVQEVFCMVERYQQSPRLPRPRQLATTTALWTKSPSTATLTRKLATLVTLTLSVKLIPSPLLPSVFTSVLVSVGF